MMIYKTYFKRYNNKISGKIILYASELFGANASSNRAKYILGVSGKKGAEKWNKAIKEIPHHQGGGTSCFEAYEQYLTANGWQQTTY